MGSQGRLGYDGGDRARPGLLEVINYFGANPRLDALQRARQAEQSNNLDVTT